MQLLETSEISKSYRGRRVVNDVSLTVRRGEIVGLLGPNGAGKTTSFYMVVGLISPDSGKVLLDGIDLTNMPMFQRARHGISYLPQEASVFRKLSVEDNLMAILQTRRMTGRERREKMNHLIDQMGLETVRRSKGYMLSGGERRRVEIARSLAIEPSFLLLDEPFSGIDPIQVIELQRIILDLKRDGLGILVTDHNVRETLTVTDRAYIISAGKIFPERESGRSGGGPGSEAGLSGGIVQFLAGAIHQTRLVSVRLHSEQLTPPVEHHPGPVEEAILPQHAESDGLGEARAHDERAKAELKGYIPSVQRGDGTRQTAHHFRALTDWHKTEAAGNIHREEGIVGPGVHNRKRHMRSAVRLNVAVERGTGWNGPPINEPVNQTKSPLRGPHRKSGKSGTRTRTGFGSPRDADLWRNCSESSP